MIFDEEDIWHCVLFALGKKTKLLKMIRCALIPVKAQRLVQLAGNCYTRFRAADFNFKDKEQS